MTVRRPLVVAVDLDDVCADRLGMIADLIRAQGGRVRHRQPADWDLRDWGVGSKELFDRLHYTAFVRQPGYRTMAALPDSIGALRALSARGHRIRIVTGRLWTAQVIRQAVADTAVWLDRHQVPADDVVFVTDKTAIAADVFVEDAPHFVTALRAAGRSVITVDTRYNRHLPGPRASSWSQVLRLVDEFSPPARPSRPAART
ncbi:5' nucleotidase, NT5C type [Plantactinospora sp. WMMB782]|uniref:5' nucleotidase, NT5C type n=1 Tax=Plantactinospora sp. WMMB782 TaxID=3404121 RepID=UPI003B92AC86